MMLHPMTADLAQVERALRNAISALEKDTPLVREKMALLLRPGSEAARQTTRQGLIAKAKAATKTAGKESHEPVGHYISSDPAIALAQSAMNAAIEHNAADTAADRHAPFEQYGEADPGWIECLIDAYITSFKGKHRFVQHAAPGDFLWQIPPKCRIASVADWGAHNTAALNIAGQLRACGPDVCIHLGDIYYAGQRNECRDFLGCWPIGVSGTVPHGSSFALNANHEMFCGARPLWGTVLEAFGQPATYFGLRNDRWQFLGFDSAYIDHRLVSPAEAATMEDPDSLVGGQWNWLVDKISNADGRKNILLSHHQPFSAYKAAHKQARAFRKDATALLTAARVDKVFGWFFGHEHLCTIYQPNSLVTNGRLVGNGSIPHLPPDPKYQSPKDCAQFLKMNTTSVASGDAISTFALLDLDGGTILVRYINENGSTFYEEILK
jgi:Calcineurin-like phosphoesterase